MSIWNPSDKERACLALSAKLDALEIYRDEVRRGLVHTPERVTHMTDIQNVYDVLCGNAQQLRLPDWIPVFEHAGEERIVEAVKAHLLTLEPAARCEFITKCTKGYCFA